MFDAGQYAPGTAAGRRLLAHELTHVVQQAPASASGRAPMLDIGPAHDAAEAEADRVADAVSRGAEGGVPVSVQPMRIRRTPWDAEGTEALHEDLIEDYRAAHGLPPHGIDPDTGRQVGPTDAEIRFGPLDTWRRGKAGVPAPAKAPAVVGAGTKDVKTACGEKHKNDDNKYQDKYHACRRHQEYVQNVLPQAIDNIRRVPSAYNAAIAALYASALPQAQASATPQAGGPSVEANGSPGTLTFGATTHTFNNLKIKLHQRFSEANGSAVSFGGPNAMIELNETSPDAALKNLPAIEDALVHEDTHIFMRVVEANNAARTAGAAAVDPNLERSGYGALHSRLESAVLPFVMQIRQVPSLQGQPPVVSAQSDAWLTAMTLLAETFAFAEAAIFEKQRAGQEFTAADLSSLPPFLYSFAYWEPAPPVQQELEAFLVANRAQIKKDVEPVILEIGEKYLSLRP